MENITNILLVSGTHGNELSGLYLQKLIKDGRYDANRSTFSTSLLTGNPEAVQQQCRFLDMDLNRQFSTSRQEATSKEAKRSQALITQYADNEKQLIIDLHNTTSNMGATLILLSESPFYTKMGAYVKQRMPDANILFETRTSWPEQPYLCTMGQYGVMIEVGAQAHGSLKSETLDLMKRMTTAVLDYIEKSNLGQLDQLNAYEAYFYLEEVVVPLDQDGQRLALVHPTVCGQDFQPVYPGEPLLATFMGSDIHWQGEHEIYPHFINEAAYCASNIAMALAEKKHIEV
ncbi:aspartoacylase [Vibrio sinaloensis DSM 21326]|uniref:Aspartoacylase n=1 Tax=Vibrio sinaloensis DSM 21326 TaxID=945550 RepID=E8MDF7_PHOS4|nr:aspartoacylase [Vibrio sinaloensis]EGA67943.1 aspartoacylase [Vibrio sinaloensis DSM 21326]